MSAFTNSAFDRRTFLQGSALATGAFYINSKFSLKKLAEEPTSPFTTPWMQPLPFAPYATPLPSFQPLFPAVDPDMHQRYEEFLPRYFYEYNVCEAQLCPHPQLGYSTRSTYCGSSPGPTLMMRYDRAALVRINNCHPMELQGYGNCEITTHVHNGHHPSESDGYPGYLYGPGCCNDHHYPNI